MLHLTPLEWLDRVAVLIPPPRRHRHRYHGVLARNAPLRAAVTAQAGLPVAGPSPLGRAGASLQATTEVREELDAASLCQLPLGDAGRTDLWKPGPRMGLLARRGCKSSRSPAPLWRTDANHRLKSILPCIGRRGPVAPTPAAFVTEVDSIQRILEHLGEPIQPPLVASAQGPPHWEEDADQREVAEDAMIEPLPAYEFVQAGELVSAIPGRTFLPVKAFFTGWNQ
jgi:Putative transposase